MRAKANLLFVILACAIAAIHATAQFLLWANMERAGPPTNTGITIGWSIVSFPLFVILPKGLATQFFWIVFGANSLLWATCFFVVVSRTVGVPKS
jgi:hypothetical protein